MNQLGIFAKYWAAGQVKTRLAKDVGADHAAELYHLMLSGLTRRFEGLGGRRILSIWPPESRQHFAAAFGCAWNITVQANGDLGVRMRRYFQESFAKGATNVILIGSDCPMLTIADVQSAFDRLANHDVVIGPTEDGGYYLIGARHEMPDVFTNVAWSTPHVWDATVERLERSGICWAALQTRYDVDDVHDMRRLKQELTCDLDAAPEWKALRRCLERIEV